MEVIMKKRILCRALIGAPIGLAISTAITIFSSLIYGDGNYYPVVPALVEQCGNEINSNSQFCGKCGCKLSSTSNIDDSNDEGE